MSEREPIGDSDWRQHYAAIINAETAARRAKKAEISLHYTMFGPFCVTTRIQGGRITWQTLRLRPFPMRVRIRWLVIYPKPRGELPLLRIPFPWVTRR